MQLVSPAATEPPQSFVPSQALPTSTPAANDAPSPPNIRSIQPVAETVDDPTVARALTKPATPTPQAATPDGEPLGSPKASLTLAAAAPIEVHGNDQSRDGHQDGQLAPEGGSDAMEVDEPSVTTVAGQSIPRLALPIPSGDHSNAADVLSSPSSTIHTAATPAVQDASTDTSPDNEGPQYTGPEEETVGETSTLTVPKAASQEVQSNTETVSSGTVHVPSPPHVDVQGRVLDGVEAQLLEESAAASIGKAGESASSVSLVPTLPTIERTSPSPRGSTAAGKPVADEVSLTTPKQIGIPAMHGGGEGVTAPMDVDDSRQSPGRAVTEPQSAVPTTTSSSVPAASTEIEEPGQATETVVERAVTRTSSGAMKRKSVSEILGESPKAVLREPVAEGQPVDETRMAPAETGHEQVAAHVAPMNTLKSAADRMRDKRRKSIPTVVFGKPTKKAADETSLAKREADGPSMLDDYFTPLFIEGFARSSHSWMRNIEHLLGHAHKTISTPDAYIPLLEHQACRVLRKVYQWQQADKWSLRQPARAPEPTRPPSQWDVVLQEMKWMRTDFREERKWKRAVAKNMAYACAEWVASTPEERKALQVTAVIPPLEAERDIRMTDEGLGAAESPLPELVHSDSPSNPEDEAIEEPEVLQTVAPSAIFALPDDEVVFSLRPSRIADQLLEELPLYSAPLKVPRFDLTGPEFDPDAHWKRPAVPLSKYVEGKMALKSAGPPQKKSRYDYQDEEDDDGEVVFGQPPPRRGALPPENANVALFDQSMQFVKEKLHAAHQFRPPVEYAMPLQSFYECRVASQWTQSEDDELRSLVRQYSYNWSLISSMVQMKSMYTSGAERRTPWECFERWISLEGLPQDMARTQYFRTYTNRMDTARKAIMQLNQAATAQQQVGPNGAVTPVPRKRPTDTVKVERRRNHKHLGLIDAMRKLAKKRESTAQRNQHQAALAANRKVPEPPRTAGPSKTPRDYSLMRWERDQQLAEKMAQYAARQADIQQQRRVCLDLLTLFYFCVIRINNHS